MELINSMKSIEHSKLVQIKHYETLPDILEMHMIERVKNAYFAYLQLARAINTSIAQYNKRFPDYTLETLENVPEPSFLNSVDSLQNFFAETLKSFKSFEEN